MTKKIGKREAKRIHEANASYYPRYDALIESGEKEKVARAICDAKHVATTEQRPVGAITYADFISPTGRLNLYEDAELTRPLWTRPNSPLDIYRGIGCKMLSDLTGERHHYFCVGNAVHPLVIVNAERSPL